MYCFCTQNTCRSVSTTAGLGRLRVCSHASRAVRPPTCALRTLLVRHTRGTELVEQRSPLQVVHKALGHADPRSTPVYADLIDPQRRHELESHRR